MSELVELPNVPGAPADVVPSAVPPDIRLANTATFASAITAVCGLSGGGKSALADTAAEYAHEVHGKTTLCYAIDPGGFGTKRVALVRAGIMRVWDPRNHVNYFETMELISLGAWPETIEDPERGYGDPNVKLIMPRRLVADLYCPAGHLAKRFDNTALYTAEVAMNLASQAGGVPCQACGLVTTLGNAHHVEQLVVRHRMFRDVGLRIYDSISAMNDAGLIIELPTMSAKNKFARGKEGGAALGSADAFTQGTVSYGTGSEAQVGFMQNRTYGWLMNIRTLPDVVVPTICTFGIEESKKDDESGGLQILGPRIAGKARTSAVPGWVGNLVYASHEPEDIPKGTATSPHMVYRLWLTTHTDPRDARRMPILAKHRGTPLGIDYLEDPYDVDPLKRKAAAWSKCSLSTLFRMLDAQVLEETEALRKRFPQAPGFVAEVEETGPVDEVIGTVSGARQTVVTSPVTSVTSTPGQAAVPVQAATPGMPRTIRRRTNVVPTIAPPVAVATVTAPVTAPAVMTTAPTGPVEAPSILQQQLEASVAKIEAEKGGEAKTTATAQPAPQTASAPAPAPVSTPSTLGTSAAPPSIVAAPPAQPAQPAAPQPPPAVPVGAPRVVRRPRPPVN